MKKMRRSLAAVAVVGSMALVPSVGGVASATTKAPAAAHLRPSQMHFANVVKISGIAWFENMYKGLQKFAKQTGVHVTQTGPPQATGEGQVSIIQSLIPTRPTVIGVDPNSEQALEGVLGRAQQQGIIVVSQEAPTMKNTNFDLEAFSNQVYGTKMMDSLATCMGGKGQYAAFVGNLTAASHMQWASAALAEAKKKYHGIQRVALRVSNENQEDAYNETKALLAKYPHLKGIEGSASTDIVGAAEAVTQLGLAGKVCIVGTSEPVLDVKYVNSGAIYAVFTWDAALTGQATMNGALMLAQGKKIKPGTNLHVPGYTSIKKCGGGDSPHCYMGNAILIVNKHNIKQHMF